MPLQNRVTPFGDIVAIPQRGLFTGNRGIIHDPTTKALLNRRWSNKRWLICTCDYKGVRRKMMAGRSWTELFFLDEATALAAGHRPCFTCRREAASRFRAAWAAGKGGEAPSADAMDSVLHEERLQLRVKRIHPLRTPVADLPDGAIVSVGESAFVIAGGRPFAWSPDGYHPIEALPAPAGLVTPPSTVTALMAGYRPVLHGSIQLEGVGRPRDEETEGC